MSGKFLPKLFPSTSSFVVFCLYIVLFSNHVLAAGPNGRRVLEIFCSCCAIVFSNPGPLGASGLFASTYNRILDKIVPPYKGILVTISQNSKNKYEYNVVTVVLLTEVFKLLASVGLYCKDHNLSSLAVDVARNKNVLALYLIPAFLYSLYNNLSYYNLLLFDPTTYNLLLQFRIFITAILFQVIFNKKLSGKQWFSLLLLMVGCMLKQLDFGSISKAENSSKLYSLELFSMSTASILMQMVCSCLAGVYNEYLLKNQGAEVDMFVQNIFMYLDSILCNVAVLIVQGNLSEALTYESLSKVFNFNVLIMMINMATVGIITSFFLKQLNSILKMFASALELILTAVLCYLLLDIPIFLNTVLSITTVLIAIYLYNKNPVKGQEAKLPDGKGSQDELVMEEVLVKI